ncbi:MAG TPA: AAA family ATPase [Pirellulales bacterium]|jgi:hypothetical protein
MQLVIEQLGRLNNVTVDIKPLTVFVGRNNTNKTWAAYALYGLAQSLSSKLYNWGTFSALSDYLTIPAELLTRISSAAANVFDRQKALAADAPETDVTEITVYRQELLENLELPDPLRFTFNAQALGFLLSIDPALLGDARVSLECDRRRFLYDGVNKGITIKFNRNYRSIQITTFGNPYFSHGIGYSTSPYPLDDDRNLTRSHILNYVRWLVLGVQGNVVAFPSERKALWTTAKLLAAKELTNALTVPAKDFITLTNMLNDRNAMKPQEYSPQLVALMGDKVLEGVLEYEGDPKAKELVYLGENAPPLPMHSVASMVRSLSGLGIYLQTFGYANIPDLIIIDEPEMNAHPEAQLRIAEYLACLANQGITIVFTTHSPYITDHLNSLMEASSLSAAKQATVASQFKLGDQRAFISQDKVAAYWFRDNGTAVPVLNKQERLVEMETFSDTSDYTANLYAHLLDQNDGK